MLIAFVATIDVDFNLSLVPVWIQFHLSYESFFFCVSFLFIYFFGTLGSFFFLFLLDYCYFIVATF